MGPGSALSPRLKTLSGFEVIPKMAVSGDNQTFAPRQLRVFDELGLINRDYVNLVH
jgi:hypothetical protein